MHDKSFAWKWMTLIFATGFELAVIVVLLIFFFLQNGEGGGEILYLITNFLQGCETKV